MSQTHHVVWMSQQEKQEVEIEPFSLAPNLSATIIIQNSPHVLLKQLDLIHAGMDF